MTMAALRREQSALLVVIIVTISLMIMIINPGEGDASAKGVVDAFHYSTTTISSTSRKLSRTIISRQTKITTGTTSLLISSKQAKSMRDKMIGVSRPLSFPLFATANRKSSSLSTSSYSSMFNLLEQYKEREGDCDVPRNHKEDGNNLGEWLHTRRMDKKKGRLDAEKEKEMEEIGVVWDIYSKQWQDSFTLLVQYKKKVGNCNVPRDHKEDEKNLGSWLNTQRLNKKKGRLDAKRESELDEIGVVWDVLSHKWHKWETMFALLLQYKEREGDCNVSQNHKEDGENLGQWLNRQRANKKSGTIDAENLQRLDEIGVVWVVLSQRWETMFTLLLQYKEREGDCNASLIHQEDGENLGQWLNHQRVWNQRRKMDGGRKRRLEEMGVSWDLFSQKWDKNFNLLVQYKEREGDCNVPQSHKEDGENLGKWLTTRRMDKKKGKLDAEKQILLEEIGVVWSIRKKWETMFTLLLQYKEREGDCNASQLHQEDGENLGQWLNQQRVENQRRKMDGGRKRRLEEMGVLWDLFSQKWDKNFNLLVQYKEREGDCNVPQSHKEDGENLGIWLTTRRMDKKKGTLDAEKQILLEEIGVVWSIRKQKI